LLIDRFQVLTTEPITQFDEKNIGWFCIKNIIQLITEIKSPKPGIIFPLLLPHKVKGGTRSILPSENGITLKRPKIKIRIRNGERR